MPDPLAVLLHLKKILSPEGVCLIRIPMIDSWAWREYGVDFVQIDAPRHLFIHSRKSMAFLAAAAGFRIDETVEESSIFQFWGSELYRRGIPLKAPGPGGSGPARTIFSEAEMASFRKKAIQLKRRGEGDQRALFMRHV